jgi:hypothetical protein
MRKAIIATAVAAAALPLPALAQDAAEDRDVEAAAGQLEHRLADPRTQDRLADSVSAMSEALLDIPVAPLMRAAAKMAGESPDAIDPHTTLRDVSPDTRRVPAEIHDKLPEMMGAMAGVAGGLREMMPALRDMAARMNEAIDRADLPPG